MTFRCGHPRDADNSTPTSTRRKDGTRYMQCAFCRRTREIVRQAERAQKRINAGGYTLGEKIAAGFA